MFFTSLNVDKFLSKKSFEYCFWPILNFISFEFICLNGLLNKTEPFIFSDINDITISSVFICSKISSNFFIFNFSNDNNI